MFKNLIFLIIVNICFLLSVSCDSEEGDFVVEGESENVNSGETEYSNFLDTMKTGETRKADFDHVYGVKERLYIEMKKKKSLLLKSFFENIEKKKLTEGNILELIKVKFLNKNIKFTIYLDDNLKDSFSSINYEFSYVEDERVTQYFFCKPSYHQWLVWTRQHTDWLDSNPDYEGKDPWYV